ncbi:MAG: hypothetical protein GAK45_00681 [Pseudomonas citronellolis]|nr:MAG: hypothetical protein GAK45_00681 [Pseudomonas citronellolis]
MLDHRHALAQRRLLLGVDSGDQCRLTLVAFGQDTAPGIDDSRLPPGFPASRMTAALPGGQYVALRLDRPGPQQDLPMRGAGHGGERRGRAEQLGTGFAQQRVQLGEAQVVAHRQPEPTNRRIGTTTCWPKA